MRSGFFHTADYRAVPGGIDGVSVHPREIVKSVLKRVEVRTLDHVSIGEKPYSFAENGLL